MPRSPGRTRGLLFGSLVERRVVSCATCRSTSVQPPRHSICYLTSCYPGAVGDADPLDVVIEEDVLLAVSRARRFVGFAATAVDRLAHDAPPPGA